MCGIAGILGLGGRPVALDELRAMCGMLVHRGPDDDGFYLDAGVGLAMRRLSHHRPRVGPAAGAQRGRHGLGGLQRRDLQLPRAAARARGARPHLRDDAPTPRSSSTSTRSAAPDCVDKLRGMFAFAVWDAREAAAPARARPPRHQAALLRRGRRAALLRLRAEGAPGAARRRAASSTGPRSGICSPAWRRRPTQSIVAGVQKLEPGHRLIARPGAPPARRALLGRALRARPRAERGAARRAAARARRRVGPPAPGERRARSAPS